MRETHPMTETTVLPSTAVANKNLSAVIRIDFGTVHCFRSEQFDAGRTGDASAVLRGVKLETASFTQNHVALRVVVVDQTDRLPCHRFSARSQ